MHIDYSLFIKLAFNEGCNYDVDSLYYSFFLQNILQFFATFDVAFHRLTTGATNLIR